MKGIGNALLLALLLAGSQARAQEAGLEDRARLRRNLREDLFLNGQLGVRQRNALYAEDALEGADGRTEFRAFVSGRYGLGNDAPVSVFADLGFVATTGVPEEAIGDPFASPYDNFDAKQNLRIYGAYGQYVLRDEHHRERFRVQLGRMSDLDLRRGLLVYDGGRVSVGLTRNVSVSVFGGRRSIMDGELPDQRTDLGAQLVLGGEASVEIDRFRLSLGHRFEEVNRPSLRADWTPNDCLRLGLGGELVIGGRDTLDAANRAAGVESDESFATILRLDGDLQTFSYKTAISFAAELQLGQDPIVYGRGGTGPSEAEIREATVSATDQARLDRLFFGPEQPHIWATLNAQQWVSSSLALTIGGFMHYPLSEEDLRSMRPRVWEVWAGPELMFARGHRVGIEGRFAFEDPGEPQAVFAAVGAGERRRLAGRVFAELPIAFGEALVLAARPEVEASSWSHDDPLSTATDQLGAAGGLVLSLMHSIDWNVSLRWSGEILPSFGADGVRYVQDVQAWFGGTF